jgi:coenzyme F420 hydrogenase subunit beta
MIEQTIESVVKNSLCTGCGTCAGICQQNAISMVIDKRQGIYIPSLDKTKCIDCGICFSVCPGSEVDFKSLNIEFFGKEPNDQLIGNYLNCYTGYSSNYDIRYNSSSGGLVTQLLLVALEEGLIDGALVTKMNKNNPLEPEPFIARTKEEIIEASQSKYCPVPANIALREILQNEGKYAIVGLPCHIHGLRKAARINKYLRNRVILYFGLLCNHSPSFHATDMLLKRHNIKQKEIHKLNYRGTGWPGYMKVLAKRGEFQESLDNYWNFLGLDFFTPTRCLLCYDHTAELADIAFGDAWLPEMKSNTIGHSIIITRNENGEKILQKALSSKSLQIQPIQHSKVENSQKIPLYLKKKAIYARLNLKRTKPTYGLKNTSSDPLNNLLALFSYFNHLLTRISTCRCLLRYIPRKLITIYYMPYNLLLSNLIKRDKNDH